MDAAVHVYMHPCITRFKQLVRPVVVLLNLLSQLIVYRPQRASAMAATSPQPGMGRQGAKAQD